MLHFTYPTPASEIARWIGEAEAAAVQAAPGLQREVRIIAMDLRARLADAVSAEFLRQKDAQDTIIRPVTVYKIRLRLEHMVENAHRMHVHGWANGTHDN